MSNAENLSQPDGLKWITIFNFMSVYIVWGSTYLAIKYAVLSFPPLLLASMRFFLAAFVMFIFGKIKGEKWLLPADQKVAAKSGMLLVLGNGLVCIAEMTIPSGLTAIIIGTTPIFIMLLNWWFFERSVPNIRQVLGVFISFVGIVLLTKSDLLAANITQLVGIILLIIAILSWAMGTLMQRQAGKLPNIFTFSGFQLLIGAFLVLFLGGVRGEFAQFDISKINSTGIFALLYLVFFGSALAFSSYIWLSRNVEPSKIATYAVVNPVVAIWLGWLIANENVDLHTLMYSLVVLFGLYFVIFKPSGRVHKKIAPTKTR